MNKSGVFNTISVDYHTIYRGNNFTLQREYIYAGEYETCTGRRIADRVGWRYADITIQWDALPQTQFAYILGMTGERTRFRFDDELGNQVDEYVIPQMITSQATRFTNPYDNSVVWRDVQLQLRFVDSHFA